MNGKSSSPMKVFFCIVTNKEQRKQEKKHLLIFSLVVQASITYKVFFISLLSQ